MKLSRDSSHRDLSGARDTTNAMADVFRANLMASFSIEESTDDSFEEAISEFIRDSNERFRLPPALMLDFMDNNVANALGHMEDARKRIADRCVEMLGVSDTTLTDADLIALLDEKKGDEPT